MTTPNEIEDESNRVTDNLDVEVLSREDEVFEVQNLSHETPEEHEYKVFCDEGDAYHCECPAFEFGNGLDDSGRCKHMRVVEQFVRNLNWRDWQCVQKQREEEARKQAMIEQKEAVFADGGEVGDDDDLTESEKQVLESAKAAVDAYDSVEEQAKETKQEMPCKDEWRSMSSKGRKTLMAFL